MDFRVGLAPLGGGFAVLIETDYEASEEELRAMLMSSMFHDLEFMCRQQPQTAASQTTEG